MNRKRDFQDKSGQVERSKAALYLRVSTEYQVDKDSLPMQRKDLIAYCTLLLGIEDYAIFEDAGYSGKDTERPAFQEMMARIRKREFSHVLVWKIDRISRNLMDFSNMYQEFRDYGVTFVSKNEQFDTSSAMGEAMLKIILVFAELERKMTAERVMATMVSRANSGQWNGGRIPFGYEYDPEKKEFSIVEHEAEVCRKLRDDLLEYRSLAHTSRFLNSLGFRTRAGFEWSPTTVWIIASSPFYYGAYRYNRYRVYSKSKRTERPKDEWVIIKDHHPAIFTEDEHERLLAILQSNSRRADGMKEYQISKNSHVFSGIAYCGKCGSPLYCSPGRLHADGSRMSNYQCPKQRKTDECDNPIVSDSVFGEFIINYLLNMLNAKRTFSKIRSLDDLQNRLLFGLTFRSVKSIDRDGLTEYYNLLCNYGSDDSFVFEVRKPRRKKPPLDPEISALRAEKEKQQRALLRLQNLYLYSDNGITEKDYLLRKVEIESSLEAINERLGMIARSASESITDEDFMTQASHLLISRYLKDRTYIRFRDLVAAVSPEILHEYMHSIIDAVFLTDGRVTSIRFRNGLTHRFVYDASE